MNDKIIIILAILLFVVFLVVILISTGVIPLSAISPEMMVAPSSSGGYGGGYV
jgi:hypothetical protein